ncbi:MAG: NAD(P)/FAD-dependent oxidoreductase [Coriobacteriales bacterium]
MEIRNNIKLSLEQGMAVEADLASDLSSRSLARILNVQRAYLLRRSVDARKRDQPCFIASVGVGSGADAPQAVVPLEQRELPRRWGDKRPVVVGMGPAGLFAALELAEMGLSPLVVERGAAVEERAQDVAAYHATRRLDVRSNVQFGEGGAGTFSDGKLTCGKNSPYTAQVLDTFVAAGAPSEILWQAKPHIGTDVLGEVVARIRKRIIACGGEVRFKTRLADLQIENGVLTAAVLEGVQGAERVETGALVLAAGHSARDTFEMLRDRGIELAPKPFSIGVRIEHPQAFIDKALYGSAAGHPALGAADYKINTHLPSGRGVYSFCMCPGGTVVAASSEEGGLCVNGMSVQARDGVNANAALLCGVSPQDYEEEGACPGDPLAGVAFQRRWERAAFELGGGDWTAPVQTVGSFTGKGRARKKPLCVEPSYPLGVREADLHSCLPSFVSEALEDALPRLGQKLAGFANPGALMTGVEARSSSPVRIVRDAESLQATRVAGLYPCGEGAGYAGGIMSAAIDGIRVASAVIDEM